ncbi:MAG: SGNH/GDSL hydrolase family protein [Clostridia bacterium]|nr:SGNH/GDSL hydrolase family protein [Clostridia bacterium]
MATRILFQGDSITDAGRNRDDFYGMGVGYPNLVKASLGVAEPQKYEFLNRGVSGNRIVDLYARIKADFINLKPDVASVYVGVNDVWHEINRQNGVSTEKFERIYRLMLSEIYEALPSVKLILLSPFVLFGTATTSTEDVPDRFERFTKDVAEKAAVCKKLAAEYSLPLVELQPIFNAALDQAPADYWTVDGVHPTVCGHELIRRAWQEAFSKL